MVDLTDEMNFHTCQVYHTLLTIIQENAHICIYQCSISTNVIGTKLDNAPLWFPNIILMKGVIFVRWLIVVSYSHANSTHHVLQNTIHKTNIHMSK